jgi:hypothetical protein
VYRILRSIHLWLGGAAALYLLVYGVSAVQMAHHDWFTLRPQVTRGEIALSPAAAAEARPAARELMDLHGLRGELGDVRATANGFAFRVVRPGTVHAVTVDRAAGRARVETSVASFLGMLNRIHHVAGVRHEYGLLNAWGAFVVAVSVGLILLAATGIYLWFKMQRERRVGVVLLAVSLGYSLPLIIWMRAL